MSAASCDAPPVSATIAVRGGLASTGKAPMKPRERIGGADADEIPIDVRTVRAVRESPRRRRGLHHHHQRNEHGERRDDAKLVPGDHRQRRYEARRRRGIRASPPLAPRGRARSSPSSARQRPISAPGKRGLKRSPASMIASTPKPNDQCPEIGRLRSRDEGQGLLHERDPCSVRRRAPTAPARPGCGQQCR